jgi:hypothetical protein
MCLVTWSCVLREVCTSQGLGGAKAFSCSISSSYVAPTVVCFSCMCLFCLFVFCLFFHGEMIFYCVKRVLVTFMYELSVSGLLVLVQ